MMPPAPSSGPIARHDPRGLSERGALSWSMTGFDLHLTKPVNLDEPHDILAGLASRG
jgi:hypothetical protein